MVEVQFVGNRVKYHFAIGFQFEGENPEQKKFEGENEVRGEEREV